MTPPIVADFDADEIFPTDWSGKNDLGSGAAAVSFPVEQSVTRSYFPPSIVLARDLAGLQNQHRTAAEEQRLETSRFRSIRRPEFRSGMSCGGGVDMILIGSAIPLFFLSAGTADGVWFGGWFIALILRLLWVLSTD
jgi:hypothetical protein